MTSDVLIGSKHGTPTVFSDRKKNTNVYVTLSKIKDNGYATSEL